MPDSTLAVLMELPEFPELLELPELSELSLSADLSRRGLIDLSSPVQSIYFEDFFLVLLCLAFEGFSSLRCLGL